MEKDISKSLVWTRRFITAAIIQGAIIVGLTIFLILGDISLKPEISRVIPAGGAGNWFTLGYTMYIVIGVIGVAVSALFYLYIERVIGNRQYIENTIAKTAAWIHLLLMNIGTTVAMTMLMFAGYIGGASMLPISVGGKGFNAGQAHEILVPFVEPIAIAIFVLIIGVISGGIGFLLTHRTKEK